MLTLAASAHGRNRKIWVATWVVLVVISFFAYQRLVVAPASPEDLRPLTVQNTTFQLEVANEALERQKGLSGREGLGEDAGLLFVFEETGQHCIWMKDMRFSIDIVWLDAGKQVIKVADDISPDTYPASFCPDTPAKYVIELNAGRAREAGITAGMSLTF